MEHTSASFIAIVSILLPSVYCEQNLCPAGTYMKRSSSSIEPCCIPCPNGTFQTTANSAGSCATCSVACTMPREIEVAPCTSIADIECQCQNGTHRDKIPHGGCLHHKPCNAGSGVIAAGNHNQDTQCEPCMPGITFSSQASLTEPCKPCASCPFGQEPDIICTNMTDTTCRPQDCGSLTNPSHGNVSITNGTKQNAVASYSCDSGHFLHGNVSRTCVAGSWSGCEPVCVKTGCEPVCEKTEGGMNPETIGCIVEAVVILVLLVLLYISNRKKLRNCMRSIINRCRQNETGQNRSESSVDDQNIQMQQIGSGQEETGQTPSSSSDVDPNVNAQQNGQKETEQNPCSSSNVDQKSHGQQNRNLREGTAKDPSAPSVDDQNIGIQNRNLREGTAKDPSAPSVDDQNIGVQSYNKMVSLKEERQRTVPPDGTRSLEGSLPLTKEENVNLGNGGKSK